MSRVLLVSHPGGYHLPLPFHHLHLLLLEAQPSLSFTTQLLFPPRPVLYSSLSHGEFFPASRAPLVQSELDLHSASPVSRSMDRQKFYELEDEGWALGHESSR